MDKNNQDKWLHFIRNEELLTIKKIIQEHKGGGILEIGGKDGYLAKKIENWGYEVISIDINPSSKYFNVKNMDATNLKFKSNSFDIIFSSQVIAHIKNKNLLFQEINRVIKNDGLIIHIVPSSWWSLITNFWYYILLPKRLFKKINVKTNTEINTEINNHNKSIKAKNRLMNLLFYHPLGTDKSFFIEIFKFSKNSWSKMFILNNCKIISKINGPMSYSGLSIFKNSGHKIRKFTAKQIPSSHIFIMKKSNNNI